MTASSKFDSSAQGGSTGVSRRTFLKSSAAGASLAAVPYLATLSTPAWAKKGVVKFGASLPLTGSYAQVSNFYKLGYEFWAETVGHKIVVGDRELPIEWVIYDDEFNAARTAQLTERMISTDKVDCIVGTYGTAPVLAQGAIAARYNMITIQGGAATRRVDEEIGGKTTFTLVASANVYPNLAMKFFSELNPKPKRIATISYDEAANREMADQVIQLCSELGMEHVIDIELPVSVTDLRPTVLKLKQAGEIDLLYHTGHDVPLVKLIQECAALGFNPKAILGGYLTTVPSVKEALGSNMRDLFGVAMWLPQFKYADPHFGSCQEFADKFTAYTKVEAEYHCAMAYSMPLLYEMTLRGATESNPLDNQVIRKKLQAMNGVETVWGPVSFNEQGRMASPGLPVIQWQGKDPELQVIYPENLAMAEAVYPVPAWSERSR